MVNQCPTCLGISLWNNSSTLYHRCVFIHAVNKSQGMANAFTLTSSFPCVVYEVQQPSTNHYVIAHS